MDAILDCIDEIALDGLDGCPIQELWKHLKERGPPFSLPLDDSTKQFLWKGIIKFQEVDFFALPEPFPHIFGSRQEQGSKDKDTNPEQKSSLDQFPGPLRFSSEFKLISDQESGIKGSCPSYHMRKNISEEIRGSSDGDFLDLKTAYERWGDCLVMVASQDVREKAIFGLDCDPYLSLSDIQFCLLEHIGQARYSGRMQKSISSNFFKVESRTTFHHLKLLRKAHLVTMQTELRKKGLRKVRQFLVQAGYAVEEKIGAFPVGADGNDCSPPKKKKRKKEKSSAIPNVSTMKMRLLKPFILKTSNIQKPDGEENDEEDNDENDDDDDGDDDEDKDQDVEGDSLQSDDYDSIIIAERPMITQAYRIIEQAGPHGLTLSQYCKACKLPFADVRVFIKNLKKRNLVHEVHQAVKKQTVAWFVAAPFVDSNAQAVKVKQIKDELKKMETKAADVSITTALDLIENVPKPRISGAGVEERVTYRKLKRRAVILEYLGKMKVVEGTSPILKTVTTSEEEEGHQGRIDRKVLNRILDDLCAQGLIKLLTTVVQHGTLSQTVDLFLHSSVSNNDSEVAAILEQCRVRLKDQMFKEAEKKEKAKHIAEEKERKKLEKAASAAEEKQRKKIEKDALKKAQQLQEKGDSKEDSTPIKPQYTVSTQKYGHLPRFPRLQLIHELLWQLVYGEISSNTIDVNEPKPSGTQEEALFESDDPTATENKDYEWIKHLKPMCKVFDEAGEPLEGWFRLADVMPVMPLNVLCKTIDITEEIEGFDEYAFDPVKKYTLFCDLPQQLRVKLKETRRYHPAPLELLLCLCQMGLVTPAKPFPHNFYHIRIFLHKGTRILDTTTSITNYKTALPPQGQSFVSRCHMFSNAVAVKNFWTDLKCVCLNTPLGVVKIDEGAPDQEMSSMKNKRLIHFAQEEVNEDKVDFPPGDQLGAAGLDRCFFSHFKRNWTRVMTASTRKRSKVSEGAESDGSVQNKDSAGNRGGKTFWSIGKPEMKQQAHKEKIKQQKKKRKRKTEESQENEKEVAGVKKMRTVNSAEKKQAGNGREKTKKTEEHSCKTGHLNAIDDEDRNILAKKVNERISFSNEEDSWLLLFRVALGMVKSETSRYNPFVCMRNILHKECASSFDKTAPNIRRRISKLMKCPQSQMTVKICLAECTHDESFKGLEDSDADFEEVFQEVVKRLRHKFSSSSLVCDGNVTLVSSLKELYDKYRVQVMASKQFQIFSPDVSILSLGPGIKCVSDINKAAIRDQIQIAFTTPQESYDAYRVFQMFNSYSREELEDVFKEMQKKNLVNRKKSIENPGVQFIRALPFAAMTFQLSSVYHRFFMHGFKFVTFYRDCAHFWKQLIKGEQHKFNKPEDSDTRMEQRTASLTPGTIVFKQSRALGGHVACILSLLTTDKLSVDVSIPEEVLNCDSTELSESTEQQTSEATGGSDAPLSEDNTSLGKDRVKSVRPSLAKTQTSDNAGLTEKNRVSPVQGVMSSKSSKTVESAPAVKQTASSSKAKSSEKSTKGKGLEKREIFTLKISSSSTSCSFTTPYDLTAAKDSSDYLTSYTEECEGQSTDRQSSKVSTVPVASLSFSGTSRSSRTALMLARGGKDPYTSLNQLPARAVNTHDFMTLNPCKNVLKLKKDIVANLTADNHQENHNKAKYSSDHRPSAFATSFDKGSSDYRTYPVMISAEISIEDYIKLSREDFGFTEMDFPLTRIIH
ncbi:general transcription factor 3C polypeptide 1-like [Stylophora pistillata]|uniref:general transcription factor 3C polypeptide 1-like n=1 Tax=Stylophora pistillata TaxID=50429 RepID=UPI000C039DD6|nr:general transcription factor 3C polypeptide 1-like [Stylophora pistillata]